MATLTPRPCRICGTSYHPLARNQRYCGEPCKREANKAAKSIRPVDAARRCAACHADIAQRAPNAFYCHGCTRQRQRDGRVRDRAKDAAYQRASRARKRAAVAAAPKAAPKATAVTRKPSTNTRPTTRRQQEQAARVKDHSLPNTEGDWWPGWDGPYSPNLSTVARELIERNGPPKLKQVPTRTSAEAFKTQPDRCVEHEEEVA
jgi:hypothetical protein